MLKEAQKKRVDDQQDGDDACQPLEWKSNIFDGDKHE